MDKIQEVGVTSEEIGKTIFSLFIASLVLAEINEESLEKIIEDIRKQTKERMRK